MVASISTSYMPNLALHFLFDQVPFLRRKLFQADFSTPRLSVYRIAITQAKFWGITNVKSAPLREYKIPIDRDQPRDSHRIK